MTNWIKDETDGFKPGEVYRLEMSNRHGLKVQLTNYGATLLSIFAPDRVGQLTDVLLGCDSLEDYRANTVYFGSTIGRYANRIDQASFVLNEKTYALEANDGLHLLHGGKAGFDRQIWRIVSHSRRESLLEYSSVDGEGGWPGLMLAQAKFSLDDDNRLHIRYQAQCEQDSYISMTNHAYFNLCGAGSEVSKHWLQVHALAYTPIRPDSIPTGELRGVDETAFDFRAGAELASRLQASDEQISLAQGLDHNFILHMNARQEKTEAAAILSEPLSGRRMELWTNQPGLQVYSGNFLQNTKGKNGQIYQKHSGLCLEAQQFPNAPNQAEFPQPFFRAGESYVNEIELRFSVM